MPKEEKTPVEKVYYFIRDTLKVVPLSYNITKFSPFYYNNKKEVRKEVKKRLNNFGYSNERNFAVFGGIQPKDYTCSIDEVNINSLYIGPTTKSSFMSYLDSQLGNYAFDLELLCRAEEDIPNRCIERDYLSIYERFAREATRNLDNHFIIISRQLPNDICRVVIYSAGKELKEDEE